MQSTQTSSQYIPVHFMYWATFQLARAVQYKYRLYEAKQDCTANECSPFSEIYVSSNKF